jgi:hypothetical protein
MRSQIHVLTDLPLENSFQYPPCRGLGGPGAGLDIVVLSGPSAILVTIQGYPSSLTSGNGVNYKE